MKVFEILTSLWSLSALPTKIERGIHFCLFNTNDFIVLIVHRLGPNPGPKVWRWMLTPSEVLPFRNISIQCGQSHSPDPNTFLQTEPPSSVLPLVF